MSRLLVMVGLLAAGCTSSNTCSLDESITAHVVMPDHDCGTLSHLEGQPIDLAPYRAAHDCAIAAIKGKVPFVVRWRIGHVDTSESYALVGDQGKVQLFEEASVVINGSITSAQTCTEIADFGECGDAPSSLCLACAAGSDESPCD